MTINFKRSAAQEASLQALLAAQQDPSSPSYHQWLTPAQFGQQFGMSAADLAQVSAWLQQEGFTITSVAQSDNSISFSGSVASVERAFQTQIHNYTVNGETHFANSTQISIPAALAGAVNSVHGLDDFRLKPRVRSCEEQVHLTDSPELIYMAPGDLAVIYDINPLYTAGDTGKGVTIAVVGQTAIVPADITDFRAAAGLPVNNPTVITVPGSTPSVGPRWSGVRRSGGNGSGSGVLRRRGDRGVDRAGELRMMSSPRFSTRSRTRSMASPFPSSAKATALVRQLTQPQR